MTSKRPDHDQYYQHCQVLTELQSFCQFPGLRMTNFSEILAVFQFYDLRMTNFSDILAV
jgi:hypothetical protein